jgi:hypothetical protein
MIESRSSRSRVKKELALAPYEKSESAVTIPVRIELRNVDGRDVVVATARRDLRPMGMNDKPQPPKEFTDMKEFVNYLSTLVETLAEQLR